MIYEVEIKETLAKTVEIEAESEEEALREVQKNYEKELTNDYVLTADDWVDTEISVVNSSEKIHLRV